MRRTLSALSVAGAFLAPATLFAQEQTINLNDLDAGQLEFLATRLAASGQSQVALQVTDQLLRRDPKNALGHFIVGQVMLASGNAGVAREASRESFRYAQTPRQSYEAARLAARTALVGRRWIAAQYWTRQTIQYAPDEKRREIAGHDLQVLRAASPWNVQFKLGVKPSNNVNGGADERTNVIDGFDAVGTLSRDAMALSGIVGTATGEMSYRIAQDKQSETRVGLDSYLRLVELSGHPTRIPPYPPGTVPPPPQEIPNSEYSAAALGLSLTHARRLSDGLDGQATLRSGQVWQGGDPAYAYEGVDLNTVRRLSNGKSVSLGAGFEQRNWDGGPRMDYQRQVSVGFSSDLKAGRLSLGLSGAALDSNNAQARSWTLSAGVGYEPEQRIGPLAFSLSGGVAKTVYPDYTVLFFAPAGGRQDETYHAELDLWTPRIGYAGFSPQMTLQAVKVKSNVSRFSRTELSVALGWRSSF